jgi:hypothetical protein
MKCPDGHEMVRDYCSEKIDYVCLVCGFIHRKEIAENGEVREWHPRREYGINNREPVLIANTARYLTTDHTLKWGVIFTGIL